MFSDLSQEQNSLFKTLIDESADGLVVIDCHGIVQFANPAAQEMFLGRTTQLVGHEIGIPAVAIPTEISISGAAMNHTLEMRVSESRWQDQPVYIATFRDVTNLKQTELALRERIKELSCLQKLNALAISDATSPDRLLERAVQLFPPAMQHPDITAARIIWQGKEFTAGAFEACTHTMSESLELEGKTLGNLEIGYAAGTTGDRDTDRDPFLPEERALLDNAANMLSRILERKSVEEKLRFHAHLIDSVAEAVIVTDLEGTVLFWNHAAVDIYQWKEHEALGQDILSLTASSRTRSDANAIMDRLRLGESWSGEFEVQNKDGTTFTALVSNTPIFNNEGKLSYIIGVSRDVTSSRQQEKEHQRLLLSIEQSNDAVIMTDADGNILYVNPAFVNHTGYTPDEVFGKNPRILGQEGYNRETAEQMWSVLATGNTWRGRYDNQTKDGRAIPHEVVVTPIRDDQEIIGYVSTLRDVTQQLQLEAELRQSQKLEAIGKLAGGVAHDFNNMLGIILGNTEILQSSLDIDSFTSEHVQEIEQAAQRAADVTRQLLAFARKQTIMPRLIDLNETIANLLNMLRRLLAEDIELIWKPGQNLHPITMDPSQIDQILFNLVINAADAISGPGSITLKTKNVETQFLDQGGVETMVALSVEDSGSGIPADIIDKIFEPFFTTKPTDQGTGLGLATVYGIVKQNNGEIEVKSEPGKGTQFQLLFPGSNDQIPIITDHQPHTPRLLGDKTILLVEDEAALLKIARRMLEKLGGQVISTTSPAEALQITEKFDTSIDILMTDVVMPEMNGPALYRHMRVKQPQLKCLFMSGYTADMIEERGVLTEDVHFLQKPYTLESLAKKLDEVLSDNTLG